jgi:hypothetical protein
MVSGETPQSRGSQRESVSGLSTVHRLFEFSGKFISMAVPALIIIFKGFGWPSLLWILPIYPLVAKITKEFISVNSLFPSDPISLLESLLDRGMEIPHFYPWSPPHGSRNIPANCRNQNGKLGFDETIPRKFARCILQFSFFNTLLLA